MQMLSTTHESGAKIRAYYHRTAEFATANVTYADGCHVYVGRSWAPAVPGEFSATPDSTNCFYHLSSHYQGGYSDDLEGVLGLAGIVAGIEPY
jgi:hypothetical protein